MKWKGLLPLTKKQWLCVGLLFVVFIMLNSSFLWERMYPIDYEEDVQEAASHFNVDPYLILAIVQNESQFEQNSASVKGAQGLMQIMPDTAEWAKEESGLDQYTDAYIRDPRSNILLGTWYLAYLLDKYDGDILKATGAYNAGQGNVDRWLKEGVWDGSEEQLDRIPFGETRHYIARVLFYYDRYQDVYAELFENV